MSNPLLTIMIPVTNDRQVLLELLVKELIVQAGLSGYIGMVEIIWETDNRELSVGAKRQKLLERAKGKFVVGIDSDDWIAPTYIEDIMGILQIHSSEIDHVGFIEHCDIDGQISKSIFSIKHKSWDEQEPGFDQVRCANPKSVIRKEKALWIGFEDMRFGEDRIFSERVTAILKGQIFINKILYYYRHNSKENVDRYGIQQEKRNENSEPTNY